APLHERRRGAAGRQPLEDRLAETILLAIRQLREAVPRQALPEQRPGPAEGETLARLEVDGEAEHARVEERREQPDTPAGVECRDQGGRVHRRAAATA